MNKKPNNPSAAVKNPKKKVVKHWTDEILSIDGINEILTQNVTFKDKFDCSKCIKNGNVTYGSFLKASILSHFDSDKHKEAMDDKKANDSFIKSLSELKYGEDYIFPDEINKMASQSQTIPKTQEGLQEQEKDDIIKLKFSLCKFIIDHQLPYSISADLLDLIQSTTNNFHHQTINSCTIDRNKASEVIRECICPSLRSEILKHLELSPFSISVDESTDIHGTSYLAVSATYLPHFIIDEKISFKEPTTSLVSVIELEDSHDGQALYAKLLDEFFHLSPFLVKNCVGIACDQGGNVNGSSKGLSGRLCRDYPYMIKVNDWSHKLNLICKAALDSFPAEITSIVNKICSHFNYSAIRRSKLAKIQRAKKRPIVHEILTYTPVRWLSYSNCLARIIDLWDCLKEYFVKYGDEKDQQCISPENELSLRLLLILLSKLTYYNKKFQNSHLYYKDVIKHIKQSFIVFSKLIVKNDMKSMSFEELFELPWTEKVNEELEPHLSSSAEFMESFTKDYSIVKKLVEEVEPNVKENIFNHCKDFVLSALVVMKKKYTINEPVIKASKAAFLTDNEFQKDDWVTLSHQFTNLISPSEQHIVLAETERFHIDYDQYHADAKVRNPAVLWNLLHEDYPYMCEIAKAIMVLPQSSVCIERVFAQLKNFKTEKRNRLNTENLQASLLLFQKHGDGSFEVTPQMIEMYRNLKKKPPKRIVIQSKSQQPDQIVVEEAKSNSVPNPKDGSETILSTFESPNLFQNLQDPKLKHQLEMLMNNALTNLLLQNLKRSGDELQNSKNLYQNCLSYLVNNGAERSEEAKTEMQIESDPVDNLYEKETRYTQKSNQKGKRGADKPLNNEANHTRVKQSVSKSKNESENKKKSI